MSMATRKAEGKRKVAQDVPETTLAQQPAVFDSANEMKIAPDTSTYDNDEFDTANEVLKDDEPVTDDQFNEAFDAADEHADTSAMYRNGTGGANGPSTIAPPAQEDGVVNAPEVYGETLAKGDTPEEGVHGVQDGTGTFITGK